MRKFARLFQVFSIFLFSLLLVAQVQAANWFPTTVKIISVHEGESIQAAIDKAESGGVILVSPGVYHETIKLKEGLILRSETGPEQTTINGNHGSGTVVQIAKNSTLDGFTITGRVDTDTAKERHAIKCVNIPATIKNNIIRDNKGTGLYITGKKASVFVSFNRIFDNKGAGIGIQDYSKATITENQCYGNASAGIGIQSGASPKITKNKCFQNQLAGIGVRHKESAPIIENNECYNNELAGIGLEKGATATLKNNYVYQNGRAGIGLKEASTALIEGNRAEKNTLSGIGALDKSVLTVRNNQLNNNIMAGITIMDGCKATIEGNMIRANGTIGIVCSEAQVVIKNNEVLENTHHGIGLYRNTQGEVSHNIINYNGALHDKRGAGVLVVSSDKPIIHHNEFDANYGPGVYIRRCAPRIEDNVFRNDLIFAKFHAAPTIKRNVFYSAGKAGGKKVKSGVDVRETSHPIIIENEFYGKFGIAVRGKSNPLILANKFSGSHKNSIDSGRSGIKVDRTCHPTIVNNIFYNGNKLTITGKSITKNVIITRGRTGRNISSKTITEAKPEQHGGKTVVIAGNLFVDAKKRGKKK